MRRRRIITHLRMKVRHDGIHELIHIAVTTRLPLALERCTEASDAHALSTKIWLSATTNTKSKAMSKCV
jgi:hypothetical protein